VHQYETSLLQNDLWRDLSGEGQKGVKVSAVSEKIRKLAGRGSRRAGKGKGPKAGRGRARNFTDAAARNDRLVRIELVGLHGGHLPERAE
jgi:hypothetical protein